MDTKKPPDPRRLVLEGYALLLAGESLACEVCGYDPAEFQDVTVPRASAQSLWDSATDDEQRQLLLAAWESLQGD